MSHFHAGILVGLVFGLSLAFALFLLLVRSRVAELGRRTEECELRSTRVQVFGEEIARQAAEKLWRAHEEIVKTNELARKVVERARIPAKTEGAPGHRFSTHGQWVPAFKVRPDEEETKVIPKERIERIRSLIAVGGKVIAQDGREVPLADQRVHWPDSVRSEMLKHHGLTP